MGKKILAVGAHPDDIEIGCGGTLKRWAEEGYETYGLVLTRGEKGKHCQREAAIAFCINAPQPNLYAPTFILS